MARKGLVMTMDQVRAHAARHGFTMEVSTEDVSKDSTVVKAVVTFPVVKPRMNKTEASYAAILESRKQRGEIVDWMFEPFSLRYGAEAFYKADFGINFNRAIKLSDVIQLVKMSPVEMDGEDEALLHILNRGDSIEIHEIKGPYIYPEAKPRFKAAKLRHQWATFRMMQRSRSGEWAQIL